jgi:hypothetical protein
MQLQPLRLRKVLADFSCAAALAALIGMVVGGTALSFVWLLSILDR